MTQSKTILISTLATSLLVLAGCTTQTTTNTNVVTNANTTNTNVVVDTNENTNVTVANENTNTEQGSDTNTRQWRKFTFDELGFSILLPFEANNIDTNYTECDEQSHCDMYGYSYSASLSAEEDVYPIIRSVSKNWSPSRRASFGEIYDLSIENGAYKILLPGDKDFDIQPVGEPIDIGGVQVYLFDAYDYYVENRVVIDGQVEFEEGTPKEQYAAVFQLPNNEKYKAVIITFKTEDLSLDELKTAIESIDFF
jgi:hypothetical protein